jgi:hypothetical protein
MDRHRVGGRLDVEDVGLAGRGPDEVEQRPDRGGLPGAVGAEEPEHLAGVDLEVDVDDPAVLAVGLGEAFGADDACGHAGPFEGRA